ncbi:MAG TPA: DUF4142 domain-containing protein [Telluria sp.]|nr:DUF4142 domain-containing protein [Telluria sp.]
MDRKILGVAALLAGWAGTAAHAQPVPTDAQITAIVVEANNIDMETGRLAGQMASDPGVKAFAAQMVTDHGEVNGKAKALATVLGIRPQPGDISANMRKASDENMAKLRRFKGAEFDRAYIDNEVAYHQSVLDALDKSLIPNAKHALLKDLLANARPAFMAHLTQAQQLQAKLRQGKSP